ncbi:MAG: aconitase family protein [Burkholderiaceae bacterium]
MATIRLIGRILFLSGDPTAIDAQLGGADLSLDQARPLRDEISTDEITPMRAAVYYDERLGRYPYIAFNANGRTPIATDTVKNGGFVVTVAGKRYGKGSSREHSPVAELAAGIRLVIAESFERIYRQNADNLGLYTSSDFGLIARIRRGEAIAVEELVAGRDALAADILRAGGLLKYGAARLRDLAPMHVDASDGSDALPKTLAEKIIDRHRLRTADGPAPLKPGQGGFMRADWRFMHEYYTGMVAHLLHGAFGNPAPLFDAGSILTFEDHLSYAHRSPMHQGNQLMPNVLELSRVHRAFARQYGLVEHGYLDEDALTKGDDKGGSEGICHAMMAERYALPGQVVVGTDSHTPHSGAVGCLAFGVGATDMANAFATGAVRFTMPESLLIDFDGAPPNGVTAKDMVLHLLALPAIREGLGVGKVFEFAGTAIAHLSTDERATLTNMVAELGGFTGIVVPDAETVRFLKERRGIEVALEPWMKSDAGARYAEVIHVDCTALEAMVARPGDPGNGVPLSSITERVAIDIAYGGSCTAGKRADFDDYHAVLSWAAERGMKVALGVKLYLQFGTTDVRDYCVERGYLEAFERVGAELLQPACGSCSNCGPGASTESDQVTVSAINRNFPGRSGPGQVWLASPLTVAASAIGGTLTSFEELQGSGNRSAA